ncbi:MAG: 50S ribosomal protein L15 [Firmicutes bacterium]|nr:50S ribosomal protein L15 [Candidatus Fiminaster equi]
MKLNELKNVKGAKTESFRKGRGMGSGNGKNCGTGNKGQKSRSGGLKAPGFEGGQTPLYRRLPKFGFTNGAHKEFAIVNVGSLNKFKEGTVVTPAMMIEAGLVKKEFDGVKVLGNGELTVKLTVKASKFSKSAKAAIEKVGGVAEEI